MVQVDAERIGQVVTATSQQPRQPIVVEEVPEWAANIVVVSGVTQDEGAIALQQILDSLQLRDSYTNVVTRRGKSVGEL